MHMLLLYLGYSSFFSNVCCLTYSFAYEILCMQLYKSCWVLVVGLTCHFNLWTIVHFSLWCHYACVLLSSCVLLHASKVCTSFSPPWVRTFMHHTWLSVGSHTFSHPKLSYLPLRATMVKALHYHPLLGLLLQMVRGLVGTSYQGDPLNVGGSSTVNKFIYRNGFKLKYACVFLPLFLFVCKQSMDMYNSLSSPNIGFLGRTPSLNRICASNLSPSILKRRSTPKVIPSLRKPVLLTKAELAHPQHLPVPPKKVGSRKAIHDKLTLKNVHEFLV